MMLTAGTLRHVVNVMRPPKGNQLSRGQKGGAGETVYKSWPCSIDTLNGREAETARQQYPNATLMVKGYVDPNKPIQATDYLEFGARRLNVIFPSTVDQLGLVAELLCGE